MKIHSVGGRAVPCGRTDMTELIVAFRRFAGAPKSRILMTVWRCAVCCRIPVESGSVGSEDEWRTVSNM